MKNEAQLDAAVWDKFQKAARKQRLNPAQLLTKYMREQLETWEDEELDEAMQRDVQRSGYTEEDAVELVRRHRLERKAQRSGS